MRLDPELLDILVCPDCKGTLTVDYDNDELICGQCGLIYPVRDDIPIMLVDQARRAKPSPGQPEDPPVDRADASTTAEDKGVEAPAPDDSVGQ